MEERKISELVFVLDKSGSMAGLEEDTIGGYNAMLLKQKEEEGDCFVSTILFSSNIVLIHDSVDIKDVNRLTRETYFTGGSTSLLDAIGFALERGKRDRGRKAIYVIITDGFENSSTQYTYGQIKKMVKTAKKRGSEFIFLEANIDSIEVASMMGISANHAVDYSADSEGTRLNYSVMCDELSYFRKHGKVSGSELNRIREYKRKRDANDRI